MKKNMLRYLCQVESKVSCRRRDQQDKFIYANISSPTVCQESVMMVIAIAAAKNRKIVTCDVTGAFLEADMPEGCEVIMSLDATCAGIICEIDPRARKFVREDGMIFAHLW